MSKAKIRLFLCVVALFWGSLYTYVPTLPGYAADIGADPRLAGMIIGSYGFTQMLVRFPLGILSDKLQKRRIFITGGLIVSVLAALGCAVFDNPYALLFFRGLSGVAAAVWVTFTVLYASYFDAASTPRAVAASMTVLGVGQAVSSYLGSALALRFGASAPFWLAVGIGSCGVLLSLFIFETKPLRKPASIRELISIAGDKDLIIASGLAVLSQFVVFATVYSFSQNYARGLGANESQLGVLTVSFMIANLVFTRVGGWLSGRVRRRWIIGSGFALVGIGCLLVPSADIWMMFVLQILFGIGVGLAAPMLMSLSIEHIDNDRRGVAMGFYQAVYGIGMTLGPIVAGNIVAGYGIGANFYVMAAVTAVMVVLCLRLIKR